MRHNENQSREELKVPSSNTKDRLGKEAVYPARVIMEACARCGAKSGDKCTEMYGGKLITRATPHRVRIEESKPKI